MMFECSDHLELLDLLLYCCKVLRIEELALLNETGDDAHAKMIFW